MEHPACFHAEPVISISIHIKTTVNIIISESENGPIPFELRQCAREMSSPLPLPNVPAIHSYTLREWASNGIIQVQFWGGGEGNYGYYLRFGYAKRINILYFIVSFWFVSFHFEVGSILGLTFSLWRSTFSFIRNDKLALSLDLYRSCSARATPEHTVPFAYFIYYHRLFFDFRFHWLNQHTAWWHST